MACKELTTLLGIVGSYTHVWEQCAGRVYGTKPTVSVHEPSVNHTFLRTGLAVAQSYPVYMHEKDIISGADHFTVC